MGPRPLKTISAGVPIPGPQTRETDWISSYQ